MASLERLTWAGIPVTSWAIRARDLSGLLTMQARRGENIAVAGRAGRLRVGRKVHDGKDFVVEFLCRGATADGKVPADRNQARQFYANMDVLSNLCVLDEAPLEHTLPDGVTVRRLPVEVINTVEPERWRAGMNATVKVAFTSADAWWRAVATTVAERTLTAGQTSALTEFAPSTGQIDDALVTFAHGSSTGNNPRLTQLETGIGIGYLQSFTAAQSLRLGDYQWTPAGLTFDRTKLVTDPRVGPWWVLDPVADGAPTVRLDLTGGGPMTIRVEARQSWAVG